MKVVEMMGIKIELYKQLKLLQKYANFISDDTCCKQKSLKILQKKHSLDS